MRDLYLHCGPHKTGTSSIQRALRRSAGELQRQGVLVPGLGTVDGVSTGVFRGLGRELDTHSRCLEEAPRWRSLAKDLGDGNASIIISREGLSVHLLQAAKVQAIVDFFERRDIRVTFVALPRNHPEWLNSHYVQAVKSLTLDLNFSDFVDRAMRQDRFNYWKMFRQVIKNPKCRLLAMPFEAAAKAGLVQSFAALIGLAPDSLRAPRASQIANSNPGAKTVFVARELAKHLEEFPLPKERRNDLYLGLRAYALARRWNRDRYQGLDRDLAIRIQDRFRKSNTRFAAAVWGIAWDNGGEPSWPIRNEYQPNDARWWEHHEIRLLIRYLSRKARTRPQNSRP